MWYSGLIRFCLILISLVLAYRVLVCSMLWALDSLVVGFGLCWFVTVDCKFAGCIYVGGCA